MAVDDREHEDHLDDSEDASDGGAGGARSRHRTDGRLRSAMLADGQQRFPWWLPLPGFALTATWSAYTNATAGAPFTETLVWPGVAIFVATTITTYFGWRLDLD